MSQSVKPNRSQRIAAAPARRSLTEFNRKQAIDYSDRGIPSPLPDSNGFKSTVENHRWGRHHAGPVAHCPVCDHKVAQDAAEVHAIEQSHKAKADERRAAIFAAREIIEAHHG